MTETPDETPRDSVVIDEAKRQTVILIFTLIGTAGIIGLTAFQGNPSLWPRVKMRAAAHVKRLGIRAANYSLSVSDWAERQYERNRG